MIVADVSDYRWLVSGEAAPFLNAPEAVTASPAAVASLRKSLPAERAALVLETARLRLRAATKFGDVASAMFFTARGLEQATDRTVAAYKAGRFVQGASVADLCSGIGGDLAALAGRGPCRGVDVDPRIGILAEANVRAQAGASEFIDRFVMIDGRVESQHISDVGAWHIDPDRRPDGRRTTRVELHEPSLEQLESLRQINGNAAIKLAPAAELPEAWLAECEAEWIGRDGECKQLVVWFGDLARHGSRRCATIVDDPLRVRTVVGRGDARMSHAEQIGRYLFEPHAAVLAADLAADLACEHGLDALIPGGGYLTGDRPIVDDGALAAFEVVDSMPFDRRKVREWLAARNVGRLEIKKRGVEIDLERLRRELRLHGDAPGCLILLRRSDRVTAVLALRIAAPPAAS